MCQFYIAWNSFATFSDWWSILLTMTYIWLCLGWIYNLFIFENLLWFVDSVFLVLSLFCPWMGWHWGKWWESTLHSFENNIYLSTSNNLLIQGLTFSLGWELPLRGEKMKQKEEKRKRKKKRSYPDYVYGCGGRETTAILMIIQGL